MTSSLINSEVFEHCLIILNLEISKLFQQQVLFTKCSAIADFFIAFMITYKSEVDTNNLNYFLLFQFIYYANTSTNTKLTFLHNFFKLICVVFNTVINSFYLPQSKNVLR